jgi:cytochrome c-type biogenesis protein CcmH
MNSMIVVRAAALICLLLLAPLAARAVQPDEIMTDPRLEARARALSAQLRCLVCQNESIDESHADLARDLRVLVRERLQAGDSDNQIRAFLVRRYGDFILLKPPFKLETWLLRGAPFLVLLAGGCIILIARRRQQSFAPANLLSEAERAKLDSLLGDGALKRAVGERHDRDSDEHGRAAS